MANILSIFTRNKKAKPIDYSIGSFTTSTAQSRKDSTSAACLDLICSAFADLHGAMYSSVSGDRVTGHWLDILLKEPNLDETRYQFLYQSALDYFNGNVYWLKAKKSDQVISMFRLDPNKMRVSRDDSTNMKVFSYKGKAYSSDEIVHIPSRFGYNGLVGRSIFSEYSAVFQASNEIDDFVNNSFNNSLGKRAIIDISKQFPNATPEQIEAIRNKYQAQYSGARNAGKPFVKADKIDFNVLESGTVDNRASQLIENREFQEKEISKIFGVPLSFLKGENKYGDLETLYTVFLQNAIKPLATSFEQSLNKMLGAYEREMFYFEFDYNSVLKTSLAARIDSYTKQLTSGILSVNEVRAKENLRPIGQACGDTQFIASNLMPLRDTVIDAYMASSKLKAQQIDDSAHSLNGMGDDKL